MTDSAERPPLPADEVIKAVERRGPSRVPMTLHHWNEPEIYKERAPEVEAIQADYPQDACFARMKWPSYWDDPTQQGHIPGYSWMPTPPPPESDRAVGHDANVKIADWAQLDEILDAFPRADTPGLLDDARRVFDEQAAGRYRIATWSFCFYERLWSLRGMENILCDFHTDPAPVARLMDALTDFYCGMIERAGRELHPHAIRTTDDIGMQTGPMFSPAVFRELFKPRYARLIETAHAHGMHFWLHTCGDVRAFLNDFIEIGLDVIHPIQKYTMDEREVAERFGGRIAFWAGMDCQRILPRGTPDEVRREVRFLIDTFDRPDGGCLITAGNHISADVPLDNLRAFYHEACTYGLKHRAG